MTVEKVPYEPSDKSQEGRTTNGNGKLSDSKRVAMLWDFGLCFWLVGITVNPVMTSVL